jgi:hypothetical protein
MRVLAPTPESCEITQVSDGYQLCARCGEPLVTGEIAVAAPRLPSWLIYTHHIGPDCPAKAVRGWKAVKAADAMRTVPNKEVLRDAEPCYIGGSLRPCVCVLDDKHIEAELVLAEHQPSDEVAVNTVDSQRKGTRNSVEDNLIAAIDETDFDKYYEVLLKVLQSCRRSTYATLRTAPPIAPTSHGFTYPRAVRDVRTLARRKVRLSKAPFEVLDWDAAEVPAEFALYSNRKVLKTNGKRKSELEIWTPQPEPIDLPFNSKSHPELFVWKAASQSQRESVDNSMPYGPIAMLRPDALERLNARRKTLLRGENIQRNVAHPKPGPRRVVQPEAILALASAGHIPPHD